MTTATTFITWTKELAFYVGLFIFLALLIPSKHFYSYNSMNPKMVVVTPQPLLNVQKQKAVSFGDLYYMYANYSQQLMNNESVILSEIQKNRGIVNPHPFNYTLLEKNVCTSGNNGEKFLLVLIHTAPDHVETRNRIRQSWGAPFLKEKLKFAVMFAVGISENPKIAQAMIRESFYHRDLIQENFIDAYHNLTYKAVMWLNWTTTFCPQAKYILKMDDDIFVNIFNLLHYLHNEDAKTSANQQMQNNQRKLYCYILSNMPVMRDPNSKWYASTNDYENDRYKIYCDGWAYIMTQSLIRPLYNESFKHNFFWIDDVYITGILPQNLDTEYININKYFSPGKNIPKETLDGSLFFQIGGHGISEHAYFEQWRKLFPKSLVQENNAYYRSLFIHRKKLIDSKKGLAVKKVNGSTVEHLMVDKMYRKLMY